METRTTLPFAEAEYDFWLPMPRVIAVEREAEGSILALFYQIGENVGTALGEMVLVGATDARLKACHAVIRNALVGGGTGEQDARELVTTYCYPARPAMHDVALAYSILKAAIYGVAIPENAKKKPAPTEIPQPS
ncbi:MAG: hypothetical protein V4696_10640 [Pseudomonadota bacterium]